MKSERKAVFAGAVVCAYRQWVPTHPFCTQRVLNSPTYVDGGIIGQDGWVNTGASTVNPIAVSNTATNGIVTLAVAGQDVNRPFTAASSGSVVYYGADISLSAAQATGDYFLHLSDGGTNDFFLRLWAESSGSGYVLGTSSSNVNATAPAVYGSTVLNFGQTYRIVQRQDINAGVTNDVSTLYVSPTSNTEASNTVYATFSNVVGGATDPSDITAFTALNFRQGTTNFAPTVSLVDNVIVATDFSSAAAVPEPAAISILGLGALALLSRRRERSKGNANGNGERGTERRMGQVNCSENMLTGRSWANSLLVRSGAGGHRRFEQSALRAPRQTTSRATICGSKRCPGQTDRRAQRHHCSSACLPVRISPKSTPHGPRFQPIFIVCWWPEGP